MGTRRKNSSILLLLCLSLLSCNKPQDSYQYAVLDTDGIKEAVFYFDMDSAVSYSTFFSCRYDLGQIDTDKVKLFIKATSPAGFTYRDTVVFPLYRSAEQAKDDQYTRFNIEQNWNANIEWTWRVNVIGNEFGRWTVSARPERYTGLHSLGFSYSPSGRKR
ncbi:MAG: hypothetical protein IKX60_01415 [Bacteroidales bacterium]|nr:hypothetical protein [Bacteroidales bacterium]